MRLPSAQFKLFQIPLAILKRQVVSSPNFVSLFSVMKDNSSVLFHLKLYMLSTKGTHQVQIFRLSTAHIKINQIPHVNSEKTSQFLLKIHQIQFQSKVNSRSKFTKFLSFLKQQQISFSSNFASIFRVMRHNSSVLF